MAKPDLVVVVCDDDAGARAMLAHGLPALRGIDRVIPVATLAQLRAEVDAGGADAVVLDVMLDREDGIDGLAALRRAGSAIPVVVLSGDAQHERRALAAGASRFIHKAPLSLGALGGLLVELGRRQ